MSEGAIHLKDEGTRQQVLIAGATAGLVSRFCIAPLDVLKIRLQLQTHPFHYNVSRRAPPSNGALHTVKSILRHEGIRGFWRGNVPAELLYITYGAIQFSAYRLSTTVLSASPVTLPNPLVTFISGALAGVTATSATYPLDLLRTRFAAQGPSMVYSSLVSSIRTIHHSEGIPGFFQGLGAGLAQIVPYMGIFFSAYETLRPPFAQLELPLGSGVAAAGVLASVIAKTGVFPLDLIRKRMQVQGPARERFAGGMVPVYDKGVWRVGRDILKMEGWRGLYRGLGVGLLKAAPASAVTMWTYERVMKELKGRRALE